MYFVCANVFVLQGSGGGGRGGGGGGDEVGKKWVGFDPTGLERAAKAARELDKFGHY